MNWVKISNDGILDVPVALNLLGASVKEITDPIGMFGTGLKYALAQAMREGLDIAISSDNKIYSFKTKEIAFRGKPFLQIYVVDEDSSEEFSTPITTDMGKKDWNDKWYIFRECYSNAKDEKSCNLSLVQKVTKTSGKTAIYLRYADFNYIYDNIIDYFVPDNHPVIKEGKGIVYKKGVRVGVLPDCEVDFIANDVIIYESRQMCEYSARMWLGHHMAKCNESFLWERFLNSDIHKKVELVIDSEQTNIVSAFHGGATALFGDFRLCPDDESIKKDLEYLHLTPFVTPSSWKLPLELLPSFRDDIGYNGDSVRDPNQNERELLDSLLPTIDAFGIDVSGEFKICVGKCSGQSYEDIVLINEVEFQLMNNETEVQRKIRIGHILIHELGHRSSGYGDYERGFVDFFTKAISTFLFEDDE